MRTYTICKITVYKEYHKNLICIIYLHNSLCLFLFLNICFLYVYLYSSVLYIGVEVRSQLVNVGPFLAPWWAKGLNAGFWVLKQACLPTDSFELF